MEMCIGKVMFRSKTVECELVIFDKNGTLVDLDPLLLELGRARRDNVWKFSGKRVAKLWERIVGVDLKHRKIDHGGPLATAPRKDEVQIAATAFYLGGYSWNEARQLAKKAYDEADASMQPPYGSVLFEGVERTLRQLKEHGLRLAIASNDTRSRTVESFKALGIYSLFDVIVGSDDVLSDKPSAEMITKILGETGCRSDEAVMVGDSASDMLMGKNAKVRLCVGVLTGFTSREKLEQLGDVVITSMAESQAL